MSDPTEPPFRRLVETANAGILVLDPDGAITFANAKAAAILRYPTGELQTLTLFDLLDEQGRSQATTNLARRRQGHAAQLECAFLAKDGSRVWVLLNANPLHDDTGAYLGSVSVLSEITEQKAVADALTSREHQLAEAQRVAHVGSWEWNVVEDHLSWTDELYRIFGLEPDEFEATYEGFLVHVHPDDHDAVNAGIAVTLETGQPFYSEYRIVRRSQEVAWAHARGELVTDDHGDPLLVRGTVLDVTETKRVEQELQHTAERYELLQTIASAANEADRLRDALQTALDTICVHAGWPVGHVYLPGDDEPDLLVPSDLWHLEDDERFTVLRELTMRTTFRRGEGLVGGQFLPGSDPACIYDVTIDPTHVRANATDELAIRGHLVFAVRVRDGPIAVLEFFSTDVVEIDQADLDTLAEVGAQLGRVAERERADAEITAARDAAMINSRLKSEFLATMSHEIRTPMNGVIGLTGLLLDTDLDQRQRQYAEGIEGAGEALLTIINDILDFSKIEAGRLELEVVDFDLVDVVEGAASLVADSARRKGLELIGYCFPDVPTVLRGDPSRLRQVLLNLAANAVKFTDEGEVVIRARLAGSTDTTVDVRFEVIDTGIGIDEADQQRLFEAFSQADASTTRRFGGTGLGLAISTQLVAAMGGELEVTSTPGEGSAFAFTLPLPRAAEGAVRSSRTFQHMLRGLKVLVVDDNETNRLILREQLTAWDLEPETTVDGASALERLREASARGRPYDLAVLDLCMAEMDGLELARRISEAPDIAATRMLLLTSTSEFDLAEVGRTGISAYLTKPVRLSQLYDALMRLTAPDGGAAAPSGPRRDPDPTRGHILVVEDNATNQMVATGLLEQLGYHADVVANGEEALAALDRTPYAAVLMDCQMPVMDGYTATAEVRRRPDHTATTPIIAMTAGAVEGDRERCLAAGMDDYITKPVDPRALERALDRWVGTTPAAAPEPPATTSAASVLDPDRLELLRAMGPPDGSMLLTLVEVFAEEAATTVGALESAVAAGDVTTAQQAAHRLCGSAGNLGAVALAARCRELERCEDLTDIVPLARTVASEVTRASQALRTAAEVP